MFSSGLDRLGHRAGIAVGTSLCTIISTVLLAPGIASAVTTAPSTAPSTAVSITVSAGGLRTATSSVDGLEGVIFEAYAAETSSTTAPSGSPIATCTTSGAGACTLAIADIGQAKRVLVIAKDAPSGYSVISTWATGPYTGTAQTAYVDNIAVKGGGTYAVPVEGGMWSSRKANPALSDRCGLDIALLIDQSGSISSTETTQMKDAAKGFVDALTGTPSTIALYTFATSAPGSTTQAKASVKTASGADAVKAAINAMPAQGNGSTNWDEALWQIARSGVSYDAVLVLTDGDPTVWHGGGNGTTVTERNLAEAVFSANAVKSHGTRVIGVGIGMQAASVVNLKAISGPTAGSDYYDTDFASLGATLGDIARKACGGTVTVEKQVGTVLGQGTRTNGFEFSADITSGGGTVTPTSGATATVNDLKGQLVLTLGAGSWPKTVTITEKAKSGYTFVDVACSLGGDRMDASVDSAARSVTVTVDNADAVSCVFLNSADPVVVTPVAPTVSPATCDTAEKIVLPDTVGVSYVINSDNSVTATPKAGYVFAGDAQSVTYGPFTLAGPEDCSPAVVVVTTVDPTVTASTKCGVQGSYTIPTTEGVSYLLDGKVIAAGTYPGPKTGTVTAVALEGYELANAEWSFDLVLAGAASCENLPATGSSVLPLAVGGVAGVLVGSLLLGWAVRRRGEQGLQL